MSFLDHIYPKFCIGCGRFGSYCCSGCVQKIPKLQILKCPECGNPSIDGYTHIRCRKKFGLDGILSFYPYAGVVKRAVRQVKYRFAFRIIRDLMEKTVLDRLIAWTQREDKQQLIIPIPLYAARKNFRGFNQSEMISRYIADQMHIPLVLDMLVRIKKTQPQVEMSSREERLHNMKNVFMVRTPHQPLQHLAILLVDDVYTTGATMRSAAHVLKKAGAGTVWGLTIAQ